MQEAVPSLKLADLILNSNRLKIFRTVFICLLLLFAVSGFLRLWLSMQSLETPNIYRKDFLQEYLLARAAVEGKDPYLPVPSLARAFVGEIDVPLFPHPTPHPPPAGLLAWPLAFVGYETAAAVWLIFELFCLIAGVCILLRGITEKTPSAGVVIVVTSAAIATSPIWTDLILGQLMIPLLLLLSGSWLSLKQGNDRRAGALLGLSLALKLMGLPILLFLAFRRRWGAVLPAVVTVAVANLFCVPLMGLSPVLKYYFKVSGMMFPLYRAAASNISLWTIGWRFFDGTGSPVIVLLQAPPLIHAPATAALVLVALPVVVLAVVLIAALRTRDQSSAFGMLICLSILIHPIAWNHYLVLMAIPVLVAARRLWERGFPSPQCILLLCLGLILGLPPEQINQAQLHFTQHLLPDGEGFVTFAGSLLGLSYTIAVLAMVWFLKRLDSLGSSPSPSMIS